MEEWWGTAFLFAPAWEINPFLWSNSLQPTIHPHWFNLLITLVSNAIRGRQKYWVHVERVHLTCLWIWNCSHKQEESFLMYLLANRSTWGVNHLWQMFWKVWGWSEYSVNCTCHFLDKVYSYQDILATGIIKIFSLSFFSSKCPVKVQ